MSHKNFIILVISLIAVGVLTLMFMSGARQSDKEVIGQPVTTEETSTEVEPVVETPGAMPQGKINVQVACESALMYTTFTDGAAADAFVAECVEGKHPDVIERYIESLGVDGATI